MTEEKTLQVEKKLAELNKIRMDGTLRKFSQNGASISLDKKFGVHQANLRIEKLEKAMGVKHSNATKSKADVEALLVKAESRVAELKAKIAAMDGKPVANISDEVEAILAEKYHINPDTGVFTIISNGKTADAGADALSQI